MRIPIAMSVVLALCASGAAHSCTTWTTSAPEVNLLGTYYFDHDPCSLDCFDAFWIYEESNGLEGLQRGDEIVDDTCHGMIEADTVIF